MASPMGNYFDNDLITEMGLALPPRINQPHHLGGHYEQLRFKQN